MQQAITVRCKLQAIDCIHAVRVEFAHVVAQIAQPLQLVAVHSNSFFSAI
jgi:hypothetical protein